MSQIEINYAIAMKDISLSNQRLEEDQKVVKEILLILEENKDFEKVLYSPFLSKEKRQSIIDEVFKNKINKDLLSFFHVIIENGRGNKFKKILKEFDSMCNDYFGVKEGICYSAFKLEQKQINSLCEALSKREGKKVVLINKINPKLIGGVKIIIGDRVYDSSVINTIDNIKKNLLA